MYCEAAGRDCKYLESVNHLKESSLLFRATTQDEVVSYHAAIEDVIAQLEAHTEGCDPDFCAALDFGLNIALVERAIANVRAKL